jgi:DNA-binding LacI/PurR family transcriptional regulator
VSTTLQDIADMLKLSKSTVSRALSGDPRVAEDTRARVVSLARHMGYTPNPTARALATRRTNTIGLAVPWAPRSLSDPFYLEFLGAAGDEAMRNGYSLFLSAPDGDGAGVVRAHTELADPRRIDGMILTEPKANDERIELLRSVELPFVVLGVASDPDVSWISGDNTAGARDAVDHLISLGHTSIACITGPPDQTSSDARFEGYRLAMCRAGLPIDRNIIVAGDFTQSGGHSAMRVIINSGRVPSAVFACNDVMALGAMRALREAGLTVPADVSVVGFDGISMAEYVDPPLATVKQPIQELGRMAVQILIGHVSGEADPAHRVLPVQYQPRDSVGPPRIGAQATDGGVMPYTIHVPAVIRRVSVRPRTHADH